MEPDNTVLANTFPLIFLREITIWPTVGWLLVRVNKKEGTYHEFYGNKTQPESTKKLHETTFPTQRGSEE